MLCKLVKMKLVQLSVQTESAVTLSEEAGCLRLEGAPPSKADVKGSSITGEELEREKTTATLP